MLTAPFKNKPILKFKSQVKFELVATVKYLCGPLRKRFQKVMVCDL